MRTVLADLLPVREVARRLGVHESTIYRAIQRGDLKARRVSPHGIRVSLSDFTKYLEALNH